MEHVDLDIDYFIRVVLFNTDVRNNIDASPFGPVGDVIATVFLLALFTMAIVQFRKVRVTRPNFQKNQFRHWFSFQQKQTGEIWKRLVILEGEKAAPESQEAGPESQEASTKFIKKCKEEKTISWACNLLKDLKEKKKEEKEEKEEDYSLIGHTLSKEAQKDLVTLAMPAGVDEKESKKLLFKPRTENFVGQIGAALQNVLDNPFAYAPMGMADRRGTPIRSVALGRSMPAHKTP